MKLTDDVLTQRSHQPKGGRIDRLEATGGMEVREGPRAQAQSPVR